MNNMRLPATELSIVVHAPDRPAVSRLVDVLAGQGHSVVRPNASTRQHLIQTVDRVRPDVVYTVDVGDPRAPGMPLVRRLNRVYDVPVVQLGGTPTPASKALAAWAGVPAELYLHSFAGDFDPQWRTVKPAVRRRLQERQTREQHVLAAMARFDNVQLELLRDIAHGWSYARIAREWGTAREKIGIEAAHLRSALGATTIEQATAWAARWGNDRLKLDLPRPGPIALPWEERETAAFLAAGMSYPGISRALVRDVDTLWDRTEAAKQRVPVGTAAGLTAHVEVAFTARRLLTRRPVRHRRPSMDPRVSEAFALWRTDPAAFAARHTGPRSAAALRDVLASGHRVLTRRQRDVLWHWLAGRDREQIRTHLGMTRDELQLAVSVIREGYGADNLDQVACFLAHAHPRLVRRALGGLHLPDSAITAPERKLLDTAVTGRTEVGQLAEPMGFSESYLKAQLRSLCGRFGVDTRAALFGTYVLASSSGALAPPEVDAADRARALREGTAAMATFLADPARNLGRHRVSLGSGPTAAAAKELLSQGWRPRQVEALKLVLLGFDTGHVAKATGSTEAAITHDLDEMVGAAPVSGRVALTAFLCSSAPGELAHLLGVDRVIERVGGRLTFVMPHERAVLDDLAAGHPEDVLSRRHAVGPLPVEKTMRELKRRSGLSSTASLLACYTVLDRIGRLPTIDVLGELSTFADSPERNVGLHRGDAPAATVEAATALLTTGWSPRHREGLGLSMLGVGPSEAADLTGRTRASIRQDLDDVVASVGLSSRTPLIVFLSSAAPEEVGRLLGVDRVVERVGARLGFVTPHERAVLDDLAAGHPEAALSAKYRSAPMNFEKTLLGLKRRSGLIAAAPLVACYTVLDRAKLLPTLDVPVAVPARPSHARTRAPAQHRTATTGAVR